MNASAVEGAVLLQRWASGDDFSGEQLVAYYLKPVKLLTNNSAGEKDGLALAHTSFQRARREHTRAPKCASFEAYLFGIVRGVVNEFLAKTSELGRPFDSSSDSLDALGQLPRSTLSRAMAREHELYACMRKLSVDAMQLLHLHYWEQMSLEELAEVFAPEAAPERVRSFMDDTQAALLELWRAHEPRASEDDLTHDLRAIGAHFKRQMGLPPARMAAQVHAAFVSWSGLDPDAELVVRYDASVEAEHARTFVELLARLYTAQTGDSVRIEESDEGEGRTTTTVIDGDVVRRTPRAGA